MQPGLGNACKYDKWPRDLNLADNTTQVAEEDHLCQEMTTNGAVDSAVSFGLHESFHADSTSGSKVTVSDFCTF